MSKRIAGVLFVLVCTACAMMGCKSWEPIKTETGTCSEDRQWVPPKKDPDTGKWTEGYCEWKPGKAG